MATELVALTANTIRIKPVIRNIPPITGKATSKPHDNRSLPWTYKINRSALSALTAVTDWWKGRGKGHGVKPCLHMWFVLQSDAIFVALWVASSFKHVPNFGDMAATKSQVVYARDFEVVTRARQKLRPVTLQKSPVETGLKMVESEIGAKLCRWRVDKIFDP